MLDERLEESAGRLLTKRLPIVMVKAWLERMLAPEILILITFRFWNCPSFTELWKVAESWGQTLQDNMVAGLEPPGLI